jgi:hypothetical protein
MLPQPVFILSFYYYFWYWKFDIFFWKIEKLLDYTLKIRILKIPIFFVEKWLTFTQKKHCPQPGLNSAMAWIKDVT